MEKSAGYIWLSLVEQLANCDLRDPLAHVKPIGLRRTFRYVFMVANVRNPIFAADFLKHYGLVLDMRRRRLLDVRKQFSVQGVISSSPSPCPTLTPK